jgi:hypothetical protein
MSKPSVGVLDVCQPRLALQTNTRGHSRWFLPMQQRGITPLLRVWAAPSGVARRRRSGAKGAGLWPAPARRAPRTSLPWGGNRRAGRKPLHRGRAAVDRGMGKSAAVPRATARSRGRRPENAALPDIRSRRAPSEPASAARDLQTPERTRPAANQTCSDSRRAANQTRSELDAEKIRRGENQTWNEEPQPQLPETFGLPNLKPEPCAPST